MLMTFTRGGQTFLQNLRMLGKVLGILVSVFVVSFCITSAVLFYAKTKNFERYRVVKLLEAYPGYWLVHGIDGLLQSVGINAQGTANKLLVSFVPKLAISTSRFVALDIALQTDLARVQRISLHKLTKSFGVDFIQHLLALIIEIALQALATSILVCSIAAFGLVSYGKAVCKKKVLRGTLMCSAKALGALIKKRGASKLRLTKHIYYPYKSEMQHTLINGTTGAGKTVMMSSLLLQIRKFGGKTIVYDRMGIYTARFFRAGKDYLLNPFDARSADWDIWAECRSSADYDTIAKALIPMSSGSYDPFWVDAARTMFATAARRLKQKGNPNIITLLRYLLTSDLEKIKDLVKDTEAETLATEKTDKLALSVKAILSNYVKSLKFVAHHNKGKVFSIRDWVKNSPDDSWLFITSQERQHEALQPLLTTWFDVAINAVLSLPEDKKRRIYACLDELPTLHNLPSLPSAMSQGRQFGLCVFISTQSLSQLYRYYGQSAADEIMDLCNTLVALRSPGIKTANMISNMLTECEVEEYQQSISYGITDNRDGISMQQQRRMHKPVLPSEVQSLNDLEAYIRVAGNFPITKTKLPLIKYKNIAKALVFRDVDIDTLEDQEQQ